MERIELIFISIIVISSLILINYIDYRIARKKKEKFTNSKKDIEIDIKENTDIPIL